MDMQAILTEMSEAVHKAIEEDTEEVLDYKDFTAMESNWLDDNYPKVRHPDGASCPPRILSLGVVGCVSHSPSSIWAFYVT